MIRLPLIFAGDALAHLLVGRHVSSVNKMMRKILHLLSPILYSFRVIFKISDFNSLAMLHLKSTILTPVSSITNRKLVVPLRSSGSTILPNGVNPVPCLVQQYSLPDVHYSFLSNGKKSTLYFTGLPSKGNLFRVSPDGSPAGSAGTFLPLFLHPYAMILVAID